MNSKSNPVFTGTASDMLRRPNPLIHDAELESRKAEHPGHAELLEFLRSEAVGLTRPIKGDFDELIRCCVSQSVFKCEDRSVQAAMIERLVQITGAIEALEELEFYRCREDVLKKRVRALLEVARDLKGRVVELECIESSGVRKNRIHPRVMVNEDYSGLKEAPRLASMDKRMPNLVPRHIVRSF